jgi:hypothetical protein
MAFKLEESEWDKQRTAIHPTLMGLAEELEIAASLRVGAMDSNSRAEEITSQVRLTLKSVAARLRELA